MVSLESDLTNRSRDLLSQGGGKASCNPSYHGCSVYSCKCAPLTDPYLRRFENQTQSAIVWLETPKNGPSQAPLILTGVTIVQASGATGPAVASPELYLIDAVIDCDHAGAAVSSVASYLSNV